MFSQDERAERTYWKETSINYLFIIADAFGRYLRTSKIFEVVYGETTRKPRKDYSSLDFVVVTDRRHTFAPASIKYYDTSIQLDVERIAKI